MRIPKYPLHLFQGFGVELEYMIVDKHTLAVNPIADKLLHAIAGELATEIELGEVAWSNELVLHVIEIKTNGPAKTIDNRVVSHFQGNIEHINELLAPHHAMLLPTGSHPFMQPHLETKIWPHEYNEIYASYHRIFGCEGHGWSNLQSTHLNLPFANDDEFTRLHTAIRLLMPIIPALSASTPIIDGKFSGFVDTRLEVYRKNQQKLPSISGNVIPESIKSIQEYHEKILERMYRDIAPYDEEKILQYEWLNSRGAIARFDRNTIEIRIIDIQECVQADLAILSIIIAVLQMITTEQWQSLTTQLNVEDNVLQRVFLDCIKLGQATEVDQHYLKIFGIDADTMSVRKLWQHLLLTARDANKIAEIWLSDLKIILEYGNLAERIINDTQLNNDANIISHCYFKLAKCLAENKLFIPDHV